jgi:hypothetical protein
MSVTTLLQKAWAMTLFRTGVLNVMTFLDRASRVKEPKKKHQLSH